MERVLIATNFRAPDGYLLEGEAFTGPFLVNALKVAFY